MRKSKRKIVRIVAFPTALVLVLAIWGAVNMYNLNLVNRQVTASRERALTQLGTYMNDIDLNLQKCMYASGAQMLSDVSSKLWRSSASAKESLSEITDGNTDVSGVYKFLSQVGEYTLSLNEKIASGEELSAEESENLSKLKKYSEQLSKNVNYLVEQNESGGLDFEEVKSTLEGEGSGKLYLGDELNDANQSMQDYPTLIYDGPFSDNIERKTSRLVENLEEVSQKDAQKKAAEFLGINEDELYFLSKTDSNLSNYTFYNSDTTVCVTQKGGLVCSVLSSDYAGESVISQEDAVKKATEYLKKHGYKKIKESYYSTADGICTVNFSYYENGVTFYTDLIKVSVALDTGKITAFDTTGYLMNHTKRDIPENPKYTLESAQKFLKKSFRLISSAKAFIPTESGGEIYVYEYHCEADDGQEILVYLDSQTGEEKDILLLLYSDGGVLTK